jgi:hypothetical protein
VVIDQKLYGFAMVFRNIESVRGCARYLYRTTDVLARFGALADIV